MHKNRMPVNGWKWSSFIIIVVYGIGFAQISAIMLHWVAPLHCGRLIDHDHVHFAAHLFKFQHIRVLGVNNYLSVFTCGAKSVCCDLHSYSMYSTIKGHALTHSYKN